MSETNTKKLTAKNVFGYAMGDTGGVLAFGVIGSFLNMYYTDVFGIDAAKLTILFLVARLWDAINDPMMGAFVDSRKPNPKGRFRPWIYFFSFPMIISLILLFLPIYDFFPGLNQSQLLIYAYITYIFYGMMYTGVNIPYGSMATVMTQDIKERSTLSMARTFGAGIGQMAGSVILPLVVYSVASNGAKYLDGHKLFAGILVIVLFQILAYQLNYRLTRETVISPAKEKGESVWKVLGSLVKNRPFITLSLASMLLIAGNMFTNTANGYLFKNYYGTPGKQALVAVCTYLPMALFMPFLNKLVLKFGKKELCAFGAYLAAATYLVMYFVKIPSPDLFLGCLFITGIGLTFFTMEVWAIVSDAIDYQEKLTNKREEGTSYAIFSFFRKMGQTVAGVGFNALLAGIGYVSSKDVTEVIVQTEDVNNGIYTLATLVPFIMYLAMALLMHFGYTLGKKQTIELADELHARHKDDVVAE